MAEASIRVSEARTSFQVAKSVQLACPKCGLMCEAVFPWNATSEQRMRIRHNVISEHVKVCTAATGEVKRIWEMEYPRA